MFWNNFLAWKKNAGKDSGLSKTSSVANQGRMLWKSDGSCYGYGSPKLSDVLLTLIHSLLMSSDLYVSIRSNPYENAYLMASKHFHTNAPDRPGNSWSMLPSGGYFASMAAASFTWKWKLIPSNHLPPSSMSLSMSLRLVKIDVVYLKMIRGCLLNLTSFISGDGREPSQWYRSGWHAMSLPFML